MPPPPDHRPSALSSRLLSISHRYRLSPTGYRPSAIGYWLSALLLLANACVLWNTVRLSEMYKQIKQEGLPCEPEDFRHISPYAFEHILPYGEYVFRKQPGEGREAFEKAKQL